MNRSLGEKCIFSFLIETSDGPENVSLAVGGQLKLCKTSVMWHVSVYEYVIGDKKSSTI